MTTVSVGFIFTDIHTCRTWREGSDRQTIETDSTSDWSLDGCQIMFQYRVHKLEKSFFSHGSSSLLPGGSMSGISLLVNCSSHSYWLMLWLVLHLFWTLLQKSAALFHNFTCLLIKKSQAAFAPWTISRQQRSSWWNFHMTHHPSPQTVRSFSSRRTVVKRNRGEDEVLGSPSRRISK